MKIRPLLLSVAWLAFGSGLAFAQDVDPAVAGAVDFGAKINEAVTTLVTGVTPPVMGFGWTMLAMFGAYALLKALLDAQLRALSYHHFVPAAVILPAVAVLFRIMIAAAMLGAYTPFHQLFPNLANGLAKTVSMAEVKEVFSFVNDISNKMPPIGMLQVFPALIGGLLLLFSAVTSFALTIMTTVSHAVVGVLTIVGPLLIPFYVLPGFDKKFWSWIDNMLGYSMIRFIAACFAYLWAHVYMALIASIKVFSIGSWVVSLSSFILITLGCVFLAFKTEQITQMIFGGMGALAADISNTAQSAVLRGVNRFLR
jgi:hypothetical protein